MAEGMVAAVEMVVADKQPLNDGDLASASGTSPPLRSEVRLDALRQPVHQPQPGSDPGAQQERDGRGWSALLQDAPYLVFVLACTRSDPYFVGTAATYTDTSGARGRISGWQQRQRGKAGVVPPYLVWMEVAADQTAAEARALEIHNWPHIWQRQLVERTNPRWICLGDQMHQYDRRPHYAWHRVPEQAEDRHAGLEADTLLTAEEIVQRDIGIANARQALAELSTPTQWPGTHPQWLEARLKAARWIVVFITTTRRGPFEIHVAAGGGFDAAQRRLSYLDMTIQDDIDQGRAGVHRIAWMESYASEAEALARQRELRDWPLVWQQRLIEARNPEWRDLRAWIEGIPDTPGWSWIPEQWPPAEFASTSN